MMIAAVPACGGGSENAANKSTTAQTTSTSVAAPALVQGAPQGAAVNALYWKFQIAGLDTKTREFADYEAAEFCAKPKVAHLKATMISMGQGLGVLSLDYAFWSHQGQPAWKDDVATQRKLAYYIVSNYCPETPS